MECYRAYSGIYSRSEKNNKQLGVFGKAQDLGSRDILGNATELFWYPSEVDVSYSSGLVLSSGRG